MWMGVMSAQNESVILMITSRLVPQGEGGNEGTITDNGKKKQSRTVWVDLLTWTSTGDILVDVKGAAMISIAMEGA